MPEKSFGLTEGGIGEEIGAVFAGGDDLALIERGIGYCGQVARDHHLRQHVGEGRDRAPVHLAVEKGRQARLRFYDVRHFAC